MSEPQEKLDISDLKDTFLECPVCVEHFNQTDRRPRLLHSCLHAFCTQCLQQLLEKEGKGQITCPLCRQVQKVKGKADTLPPDPVRGKLVEYVQIKHKQRVLCGECEEHDAISQCQECQSYLCKQCDFVHRHHRVSKDHPIISLEEVLQQPVKNISKGHFCPRPRHRQHHLEFYCATDEQLCCVSCTVLDHRDHDLLKLDEAATTRKQELETRMKEVYKLADHLKEVRKESTQQEKCIADTKAKALSDIDDMFSNLKKVLDTRKRELVDAVDERSAILLSTVQKTSASHEQTLAIIESTATYFSQAKGKADVVEMLQMYPAIKRSVEGLKEPEPISNFAAAVSDFTFKKNMLEEMEVLVNSLGGFCQSDKDKEAGLKKPSKKRNGCMQNVSLDQFNAIRHLIGQKTFQEFCDFEGTLQDQMKIYFLGNGSESSSVQQRIQGVIQEKMEISVGERGRAKDVASEAMKGHTDVYIKYQEDRNIMLMFAEDWDKMARAKKRVALCFGQAKVSYRGGRRFAGPKTAEADSSVKVSFDKNTGCAKGRHIIVRVYEADITKVQTEVIVNGANEYLSHGTEASRAIADAAGPTMTRESNVFCQKNGPIKVSHLAITSAGRLPYKMVFHAVGPEWYKYSDKNQCLEDLCHTILRCLCEAEKNGIVSIAIPSISAAIFRVPPEACAQMYVRALKSFDQVDGIGNLKEVHFVDISNKMVAVIQKELEVSWGKPPEEGQGKRDTDFIQQCLNSTISPSVNHPFPMQSNIREQDNEMKKVESSHPQDGPGVPPQGFFKFSDTVSLNIFKNSIFEIRTHAIIVWEAQRLYAHGRFTKALIEKAGEDYNSERKQHAHAKFGDIIQTSGGKLSQDYIFHVVLRTATTTEEFTTSLRSVFGMCVKNKCTTVTLPVFSNIYSSGTDKCKSALFIETVVDALMDLTRHKINPSLHVHIVNNQDSLIHELQVLLHQYLISLGMKETVQPGKKEDAKKTQAGGEDNNCAICLDPIKIPHKLKCGHTFCDECINKAFKVKKICPTCKTVCGTVTGNMPDGRMSSKVYAYGLPGYGGYNTIIITYSFLGGTQRDCHPHPGQRYRGTNRTAYLPDTAEGRKVLALLQVAWERKLTFTIGTSVTLEDGVDRVTWNEIHHKTNRDGGPTNYGYPDPDYLKRVEEELAAQGVTEKDLGTDV